MAIFGKKRLTKEELIEALNALSEDDKKEVLAKTAPADDPETKEDIVDKDADGQPEQTPVDESDAGKDDEQNTDGGEDKSGGEEDPGEPAPEAGGEPTDDETDVKDGDEAKNKEEADDKADLYKSIEALAARLDAYDEKLGELTERLSHVVESFEDGKPFGAVPQPDEGGAPNLSTEDQIMRSYNPAYRR